MYDFVITILYLSEKMRNIKGAIYADIRLEIFWHVHVNGKIKLVISFECYWRSRYISQISNSHLRYLTPIIWCFTLWKDLLLCILKFLFQNYVEGCFLSNRIIISHINFKKYSVKATCICNIQKNNLFHLLAVWDRQLSSWTSLTLADFTRAGSIWLWLNVHVYCRFFCNLPQCSGIVNIVFSQLYFWSGDL